MPTLTLANIQTMIGSLVTQYQTLAATPVSEYGVNGRMVRKHKLAELRTEIVELTKLESQLGGGTGTTALAELGEP